MINLINNNDISERVGELQDQGLSNPQIYNSLKKEGYNSVQIDDAINQKQLAAQENTEETSGLDEAPEPGLKPSLMNEPDEPQGSTTSSSNGGFGGGFSGVTFHGDFQGSRSGLDDVETLIEQIIDEKWKTTIDRIGNLDVWKERIRTDVVSIKQELIRLEHRFENIEKAVLGKISQYDRNIVNIGNEMKVLEQVFQKIMTPLTTNIKELSRITKELKGEK